MKYYLWKRIIILCSHVIVFAVGEYSFQLEHELRDKLFSNYNTFVRPSEKIHVSISLDLMSLITINLSEQQFEFAGFFTVNWRDNRFDWSANSNYSDDIENIFSNQVHLWRPLLILENSVGQMSVLSDEQIPMTISKHGDIKWPPAGVYKTFCECDATYFPFDTQTCNVVVTTWAYTATHMHLFSNDEHVRTTYYKNDGQWTLIRTSVSHLEVLRKEDSYHNVVFSLTFKRRPWFQLLTNIMPMMMLGLLGTMIFRVPARSGEKIGYTLTIILSYTVYLTAISTALPSSSHTISILSVYLLFIMVVGVLSVFVTVCVLHCHLSNRSDPVPDWLVKMAKIMDFATCNKRKWTSRNESIGDNSLETEPNGCHVTESSGSQATRLDVNQFKSRHVPKMDVLQPKPKDAKTSKNENTIRWHDVGTAVDAFCFRVVFFAVATFSVILSICFAAAYMA